MFENMATQAERVQQYSSALKMMNGAGDNVKDLHANANKVGKAARFTNFFRDARRKHYASNPIMPGVADYVNWPLYDRLTFAAGGTVATANQLFVIPAGSGGKTKADTNLTQVSVLPNPWWFNCTGIGFYFDPNINPIDLDAILNQSYFEFVVNNKSYMEGKLAMCPAPGGVTGMTTRTSQSQWTNGTPLVGNMFDLRLPSGLDLGVDQSGQAVVANGLIGITILQQQNFNVNINLPGGALTLTAADATPNAGTGAVISCWLYGVLSRNVS